MEHDLQLRAAACAIYDVIYPGDHRPRVGFDEAERFKIEHYRQAVGAAQQARAVLASREYQPELFPLTPAFA